MFPLSAETPSSLSHWISGETGGSLKVCLHSFPIVFESPTPDKACSSRAEESISHSSGTRRILFHHINKVIV